MRAKKILCWHVWCLSKHKLCSKSPKKRQCPPPDGCSHVRCKAVFSTAARSGKNNPACVAHVTIRQFNCDNFQYALQCNLQDLEERVESGRGAPGDNVSLMPAEVHTALVATYVATAVERSVFRKAAPRGFRDAPTGLDSSTERFIYTYVRMVHWWEQCMEGTLVRYVRVMKRAVAPPRSPRGALLSLKLSNACNVISAIIA